ncbi:MAG: SPFH domain-containing protein [Anaerolineae bacterium]|nr:SPFH domain-containing protein [Anaerolineae bacterium]
MSRRERLIFVLGILIVAMALGLWLWLLLPFAAWYVKNIPDVNKNLPFASWLRTQQQRFYDWLSGLLMTWFRTGMLLTVVLGGVSVGLVYVTPPLGLLPASLEKPVIAGTMIYVFSIFSTFMGFFSAKSSHWDVLFWRAEPAARALLADYDDPTKPPDPDVVRHIVDAEIGINKATWVVSQGKVKMHHPAAGKLAKFGGPGILIVEEGYAVVLYKSGKISRVVGRGLNKLLPFERPHMIVPLAAQAVSLEVRYLVTQDGGLLEIIEGLVFCKLDAGRRNRDSDARYPFDDELILDKVWSPKGSEDAKDAVSAVKPISESALRQVVARHTLHEFFDNFEQTRLKIRDELVSEANQITDPLLGFKVIAAAINKIEMPKETEQKLWQRWAVVKDEHIKEKEAAIERERLLTISEGEAARVEREERARIQAQLERERRMVDIDAARLEQVELQELRRRMEIELDRLQREILVEAERARSIEDARSAARTEAFLRLLGTMRVSGFDETTMRVLAGLLTIGRSELATRRALRRMTSDRTLPESSENRHKSGEGR